MKGTAWRAKTLNDLLKTSPMRKLLSDGGIEIARVSLMGPAPQNLEWAWGQCDGQPSHRAHTLTLRMKGSETRARFSGSCAAPESEPSSGWRNLSPGSGRSQGNLGILCFTSSAFAATV